MADVKSASDELSAFLNGQKFGCIMADPPWRFQNRTGKVAPEHKRLARYPTLELNDICALPVAKHLDTRAHCYLWVPNALLPEGLHVLKAWGFEYKSHIVWEKIRKDGGPDGRGVGFYFRNVTELLLFGTRGKDVRTLSPGRSQVNLLQAPAPDDPRIEPDGDLLKTRKREHSRKPDEQYNIIESCSWGPYLELFGRGKRKDGRSGVIRRTTITNPHGRPIHTTQPQTSSRRRLNRLDLVDHLEVIVKQSDFPIVFASTGVSRERARGNLAPRQFHEEFLVGRRIWSVRATCCYPVRLCG